MLMLLKVSVPGPEIGRDSKPMLLKMPEGRVLSVPAAAPQGQRVLTKPG